MKSTLGIAFGAAAICLAAFPAFSQGMILQIEIGRANPNPVRPRANINTLQEFAKALRHCYNPPPVDEVSQPVNLTFQVSFRRSGELFGKPRVVNFARPVSSEERQRYYQAVAEAVNFCSPMPFTDAMGGASAGRTFRISFIDNRNRRQAMINDR